MRLLQTSFFPASLLSFLLFFPACPPNEVRSKSEPHPEALRQHQLGVENLQRGQVNEAERHFQQALEADGGFAPPHDQLGRIAMMRGLWKVAEEHFRKAVTRDANLVEAWDRLGLTLRAQKRYKSAVLAFERGLDVQPDAFFVRLHLAETLRRLGAFGAARTQNLRLIADNPNRAEPHHEMGLFYLAQQQSKEALVSFERAVAREPKKEESHLQIARILLAQRDFRRCLVHLAAILHLNPRHPEALRLAGLANQGAQSSP